MADDSWLGASTLQGWDVVSQWSPTPSLLGERIPLQGIRDSQGLLPFIATMTPWTIVLSLALAHGKGDAVELFV